MREFLPGWSWYHTSCRVENVEERLKEKEKEESETDSAKRVEFDYNSWKNQKEKENSQIDEMFSALRVFD